MSTESKKIYRQYNHIYFYDDVTDESIAEFIGLLRDANVFIATKLSTLGIKSLPIHLHINSGGGDVFSGLAATSHIENSEADVYTYIEGQCASAATLMSLSGAKRFITARSFMLIHEVSYYFDNSHSHSDLKDEVSNSDAIMKVIMEFYGEKSELKKKTLKKILKKDLYFSASECLKLHLVDQII